IGSGGFRVKLLDEVLRCFYVARLLASGEQGEWDTYLRDHVYSARKRFISLLQEEMKSSLKPVGPTHAGDRIPSDPTEWGVPECRATPSAPHIAPQDRAAHP